MVPKAPPNFQNRLWYRLTSFLIDNFSQRRIKTHGFVYLWGTIWITLTSRSNVEAEGLCEELPTLISEHTTLFPWTDDQRKWGRYSSRWTEPAYSRGQNAEEVSSACCLINKCPWQLLTPKRSKNRFYMGPRDDSTKKNEISISRIQLTWHNKGLPFIVDFRR